MSKDNLCPVCNKPSVSSCRCFRHDSTCRNGHEWHTCTVHHKTVMGHSDHGLDIMACTCACGKQSNPAKRVRQVGEETFYWFDAEDGIKTYCCGIYGEKYRFHLNFQDPGWYAVEEVKGLNTFGASTTTISVYPIAEFVTKVKEQKEKLHLLLHGIEQLLLSR
jgi:hypothetical protein